MKRTTIPLVQVNLTALWAAIATKVFGDPAEPSYRKVAAQIGTTPQVLTFLKQAARRERDYRLDLEVFLSLCYWLDRDPRDFTYPPVAREAA